MSPDKEYIVNSDAYIKKPEYRLSHDELYIIKFSARQDLCDWLNERWKDFWGETAYVRTWDEAKRRYRLSAVVEPDDGRYTWYGEPWPYAGKYVHYEDKPFKQTCEIGWDCNKCFRELLGWSYTLAPERQRYIILPPSSQGLKKSAGLTTEHAVM